jgi:hypothetical protein
VPSPENVQALIRMITGFRISQMIYVAARLGIADLLKDGPRAADELAEATGTHAPSLYRLLRALASLGVFAEDEEGRFTLTPLAALLQTGVPGSQRARALFYGDPSSWQTWGHFLHSVTTGETAFGHIFGMDAWEYHSKHPELNEHFNAFMSENTAMQIPSIVAAYDFTGVRTLVDVGGGQGVLIAAILKANPHLNGILCDAPHVVNSARPVLEAEGVIDRCQVVPCDFFSSVPAGGDAYLLKSIVHDWSDDQAIAILKTCRRAMPEDGRLLLVENVLTPGNEPDLAKLLDLQMLVELGGLERTEAGFGNLLARSGLQLTRVIAARAPLSIIEAIPA